MHSCRKSDVMFSYLITYIKTDFCSVFMNNSLFLIKYCLQIFKIFSPLLMKFFVSWCDLRLSSLPLFRKAVQFSFRCHDFYLYRWRLVLMFKTSLPTVKLAWLCQFSSLRAISASVHSNLSTMLPRLDEQSC